MKIYIWTRTLDHLQIHTFRAIQALMDQQMTCVLTEPENLGRKKQGWQPNDLNNLEVIVMKEKGWLVQSLDILEQNSDAIHVFCGFWSERRLFPLIVYGKFRGLKAVVINEQYSTSPVGYMNEEKPFIARTKVIVRPFAYRIAALFIKAASYRKKPLCVLTISPQSREQHIKAGFDKNVLFPFGYFVPPMLVTSHKYETSVPLRLIFVAALLKRKGLDVAICALHSLNQNGIKVVLDVYGSGDPGAFVPNGSKDITYKGVIPTEQAQSVIAQYDALILPSRHDGWGVVVNEALLQGVPVIVSDHVGAKCLIEAGPAGMVFRSEDSQDLAEKIKILIENPALLAEFRANACKIGRQILPEHAAKYFLEVLNHFFFLNGVHPRAVWGRDL